MTIYDIHAKVSLHALTELTKAIEKWGLQSNISLADQFLILSEEVGEIAMSLLDKDYDNAQTEIYQTVAMLTKLSWLIERRYKK